RRLQWRILRPPTSVGTVQRPDSRRVRRHARSARECVLARRQPCWPCTISHLGSKGWFGCSVPSADLADLTTACPYRRRRTLVANRFLSSSLRQRDLRSTSTVLRAGRRNDMVGESARPLDGTDRLARCCRRLGSATSIRESAQPRRAIGALDVREV